MMLSLKVWFVAFSLSLAVQETIRAMAAPSYTAGEVLTFFAAAGVLITGVGAVVVNIIVALRTGTKLDTSLAKTDGLVAQVKEVHTLTNSNLTAVKSELATVVSQNKALHELVAELRSERDKSAIVSAFAATPTAVPPATAP